jgi:uncharacterized protein (TIGR04255 family)
MADDKLPSFRKPPVVETVLGVQFDRLSGLTNAHLGGFWKHLRATDSEDGRWDEVNDAPPIELTVERFEDGQSWARDAMTFRVSQDPSCRIQIRNARHNAMVQLQNGRLHYNWIGRGGQDYSRYCVVRPAFDRVYRLFQGFLQDEKLGAVSPNQWEVTYVNHLPKGSVWHVPADWAKVFVGLPGAWAASSEVQLESLAASWHFEIPPRRGRLHVELKHAKLIENEGREILQLTLTARGPVNDETTLVDGLDLGRRAVVLGFRDITSPEAHRHWELES